MCGIQYNNINLGCYQSCHTIQYVGGDTYTGAAEQSALGIMAARGYLMVFSISLMVIRPFKLKVLIYDRQLLFFLPWPGSSLPLPE